MKALVIGGSVTGLAVGLFAARRGVEVTIVDADDETDPGRRFDETVARSVRRPTPQAAHSHAFLSRSHAVLQAEAPDVLDAFAAHGVESIRLADHLPSTLTDRTSRDGDDDLVVLRSRRSTIEAVLRQVVAAEPGVTIRAGVDVTGLLYDDGAGSVTSTVPHVVGVTTGSGELRADVVLDASGRKGSTYRWLDERGISAPEEVSDCGIAYYSRFYRRYMGERIGELNRGYTAGSSFDRYSTLVFPGDHRSFSVTFGILPEDAPLRKLRHDDAFEAAAHSIPVIADWVERAEPISEVRSMTGMKNRLRRLVSTGPDGDRAPLVTGLIPIADAAGISNPAHSRGCSLAVSHAARIADLIVETHDRHDEMIAADDVLSEVIEPWITDSRRQDEARLSRWRPDGGHVAPLVPPGQVSNGQAWTAAHHDRDVWSRFTRLQQLLASTDEVLSDDDTVARVRSVVDRGLGLPTLDAPDHDALGDLLSSHAPSTRRRDLRRLAASV